MHNHSLNLKHLLQAALLEDVPHGDITSEFMLLGNQTTQAQIIAKEEGILYGSTLINILFSLIDEKVQINLHKNDGDHLQKGAVICQLTGNTKAILKAERVMLNFLQRLSGISTITHKFIKKLNDPKIKVLDTRKTTPLFRELEKQAVVAGGGYNHRFGLSDMVLIKENHLAAFLQNHQPADLPNLFQKIKATDPDLKIEIEIAELAQLTDFNLSAVDYIMFDNFSLENVRQGISLCRNKDYSAEIEVSGNITLDNIQIYAGLDLQRISIGSLTHSVKALDLSLLFY